MMTSLFLVMALGLGGQASKTAPQPPTAPELAALVERVVRLTDLQRRKLELEGQLAGMQLGAAHPDVVALRTALADINAAIQREGLQSYRSQAYLLAEERVRLENALARLRVGRQHPEYLATSSTLAAMKEQQRVLAVTTLAGGLEAQIRAEIAARPNELSGYLTLAELFNHAGRTDEAGVLLTEAQAALKRAGGR